MSRKLCNALHVGGVVKYGWKMTEKSFHIASTKRKRENFGRFFAIFQEFACEIA
jgi:hypothetical protein